MMLDTALLDYMSYRIISFDIFFSHFLILHNALLISYIIYSRSWPLLDRILKKKGKMFLSL